MGGAGAKLRVEDPAMFIGYSWDRRAQLEGERVSLQVFKDAVRLTLSELVSSFVRTDTGASNSPMLLKRTAKTDMDGVGDEIVAIGGLVDTKQSTSNTAVPFLPSWFDSTAPTKLAVSC